MMGYKNREHGLIPCLSSLYFQINPKRQGPTTSTPVYSTEIFMYNIAMPPQPNQVDTIDNLPQLFTAIEDSISQVILGKRAQIRLALCCLIAEGHLLIEDIPGIGKTTLAKVLAQTLGLKFQRIQCTSDMLPGDMLGVSIFDQKSGQFTFHEGPVFTQILLADEINRTTPKTQSALLEAMEEGQVSSEGTTRPLPQPFFVVATQNAQEHSGTYPLPDSQLDRFLFRISIGYPGREAEYQLLKGGGVSANLHQIKPMISPEQVQRIQHKARTVLLAPSLIEYIQDILAYTRESGEFSHGLSPRAGLSLARAAQSWALIQGRDFVVPEDVQAVLPHLAGHRLQKKESLRELTADELKQLIASVPVPL